MDLSREGTVLLRFMVTLKVNTEYSKLVQIENYPSHLAHQCKSRKRSFRNSGENLQPSDKHQATLRVGEQFSFLYLQHCLNSIRLAYVECNNVNVMNVTVL